MVNFCISCYLWQLIIPHARNKLYWHAFPWTFSKNTRKPTTCRQTSLPWHLSTTGQTNKASPMTLFRVHQETRLHTGTRSLHQASNSIFQETDHMKIVSWSKSLTWKAGESCEASTHGIQLGFQWLTSPELVQLVYDTPWTHTWYLMRASKLGQLSQLTLSVLVQLFLTKDNSWHESFKYPTRYMDVPWLHDQRYHLVSLGHCTLGHMVFNAGF